MRYGFEVAGGAEVVEDSRIAGYKSEAAGNRGIWCAMRGISAELRETRRIAGSLAGCMVGADACELRGASRTFCDRPQVKNLVNGRKLRNMEQIQEKGSLA